MVALHYTLSCRCTCICALPYIFAYLHIPPHRTMASAYAILSHDDINAFLARKGSCTFTRGTLPHSTGNACSVVLECIGQLPADGATVTVAPQLPLTLQSICGHTYTVATVPLVVQFRTHWRCLTVTVPYDPTMTVKELKCAIATSTGSEWADGIYQLSVKSNNTFEDFDLTSDANTLAVVGVTSSSSCVRHKS